MGENLTAIEYFDEVSNKIVDEHLGHRNPLGFDHKYYVLTEVSDYGLKSDPKFVEEKLFALFDSVQNEIAEGVVAQDGSQFNTIWKIRETIVEGFLKEGRTLKYDFSLPIDKFDVFLEQVRERASPDAKAGGYGHIGDGNIHVNVSVKGYEDFDLFKDVEHRLEPWIYYLVGKYNGSISAEHGVGSIKAPYLSCSRTKEMINTMKTLKTALDPNGILNPYKLFPEHQ